MDFFFVWGLAAMLGPFCKSLIPHAFPLLTLYYACDTIVLHNNKGNGMQLQMFTTQVRVEVEKDGKLLNGEAQVIWALTATFGKSEVFSLGVELAPQEIKCLLTDYWPNYNEETDEDVTIEYSFKLEIEDHKNVTIEYPESWREGLSVQSIEINDETKEIIVFL